jgi:hypothetical protein
MSLSILNEICKYCKHTCESTLFATVVGQRYLRENSVYFSPTCNPNEECISQPDLQTAGNMNLLFFNNIAVPHLVGASIINKHIHCLKVCHDHGAFEKLFEDHDYTFAYLVHVSDEFQYESQLKDLLIDHYDHQMFHFMITAECAYTESQGIQLHKHRTLMDKFVRAILKNHHVATEAFAVILSNHGVYMDTVCTYWNKELRKTRCTMNNSPQLIEYCRPYVELPEYNPHQEVCDW